MEKKNICSVLYFHLPGVVDDASWQNYNVHMNSNDTNNKIGRSNSDLDECLLAFRNKLFLSLDSQQSVQCAWVERWNVFCVA